MPSSSTLDPFAHLIHLRGTDPAAALALLGSTWKTEAPEDPLLELLQGPQAAGQAMFGRLSVAHRGDDRLGLFAGFGAIDLVARARVFPDVSYWRLKGVAFMLLYFAAATFAPERIRRSRFSKRRP